MFSTAVVLLVFAATGIQFGSEALPSGGNTYIVQIEPELIDTFREKGFSSDVPPGLAIFGGSRFASARRLCPIKG